MCLPLYFPTLTITRQRQTTLDGSFTRQPRVPPFSTQGLIDHLVELIVSEDNAFHLLDKPAFRQLLHYLRPTLLSKDIPTAPKFVQKFLSEPSRLNTK
jgi:hypothetical protein